MTGKIKFGAKSRNSETGETRLKYNAPSAGKTCSFRCGFYTKVSGLFLLILILLNLACESPSLKANSAKPAVNAVEDKRSGLEKDLQTMRDADFDFVYVFRRKDGGALDSEDKKYLKANSPVFTNRFVLTDENKAVIAGSSYKFEAENLEILQKRFVVENFSKPETQEVIGNSNSSK